MVDFSDKMPIAFGCEPLGGVDWGEVDLNQVYAAIDFAWDSGVRTFDTADVYGLGRSEEELCRVLGSRRHEALIVTKFGCRWRNTDKSSRATIRIDASSEYVREAVEGSLRRLKLDVLPLYLLHWPDKSTPETETFDVLEELKSAGKIIAYGVSNFSWKDLAPHLKNYDIAAMQNQTNFIKTESLIYDFPKAKQSHIFTMGYGALAQGMLAGAYCRESAFSDNDRRSRLEHFSYEGWQKYDFLLKVLKDAADAHGKTMAQMAIKWIIEKGLVSKLVIGAKTRQQIAFNLDVLNWTVEPEWQRKLNFAAGVL